MRHVLRNILPTVVIRTGRDLPLIAPHVATIPGLAIMIAVLGSNPLGDGLRDALEPGYEPGRTSSRSTFAPWCTRTDVEQ